MNEGSSEPLLPKPNNAGHSRDRRKYKLWVTLGVTASILLLITGFVATSVKGKQGNN